MGPAPFRRLLPAAAGLALLAACGVPGPPDVPALAARAARGDGAAAEELVDLLGSGRPPETRTEAYQALLQAGPRVAGAALEACDDVDAVRREHALAVVGNLKLAAGYDKAVAALADAGFPRRYVAAWALGELGDARAVPVLLAAVERQGGEVAREAARSLVRLGQPAAGPVREALPRLRGEAKGYAIRILGDLRDAQALGVLTAALADPATRADAVWSLGTIGRAEAAPAVLPLLADADWRVRLEACRSLGLLEARQAESALERVRQADAEPAVREWAARSLGLLRGQPQSYRNALGEAAEPENLYR